MKEIENTFNQNITINQEHGIRRMLNDEKRYILIKYFSLFNATHGYVI
jgi:hypothetical protein